ncbi:hypothetical protein [Candidatus Rariloculus sp.]|uniref:hypothetical protein n=1 Tax=Candidatus Rariloculus sp. TaxID=3101265 RepID=UPI003D13BD05
MADHPAPLKPPHVSANASDFSNPHRLSVYRGPMTGRWFDIEPTTTGHAAGGSAVAQKVTLPPQDVDGAGDISLLLSPDPHIQWDFRHDGISKDRHHVPVQQWPVVVPPPRLTAAFASHAGAQGLPDWPVTSGHIVGICRISAPIDIGRKSDSVDEVRFYLVNFQVRYLLEAVSSDGKSGSHSALRLQSGPWRVDIEILPDFYKVLTLIEERQAYGITHLCRLWREAEDGTADDFSMEDAEPVLEVIRLFVSFVRSAMVGLALPVGYKNGQSSFESWHVSTADAGRKSYPHERWSWPGWYPPHHPPGYLDPHPVSHLPSIFESFAGKFLHEDDSTRQFWQNVLRELVHTYTDAERVDKDRAIVPACIALETLGWAILVVQEKWLTGDRHPNRGRGAYERLSAADRLRLLLRWAGIPADIPPHLPNFSAKAAQDNGRIDSADLIAWTRNRVVHPDKHDQLSHALSIEAWAAAMWCTELISLKLLGYEGYYRNRLNHLTIERVPWADT